MRRLVPKVKCSLSKCLCSKSCPLQSQEKAGKQSLCIAGTHVSENRRAELCIRGWRVVPVMKIGGKET